jgi:hypothetical protein
VAIGEEIEIAVRRALLDGELHVRVKVIAKAKHKAAAGIGMIGRLVMEAFQDSLHAKIAPIWKHRTQA